MQNKNRVKWLPTLFLLLVMGTPSIFALEISDIPLESQIRGAPPDLMFIIDNSDAMDAEFMTSEEQGLFEGRFYLFPGEAYSPSNDHISGLGQPLNDEQRKKWKSQWCGYNRLYYNPNLEYAPWPSSAGHRLNNADLKHPLSNPTVSETSAVRINFFAPFCSIGTENEKILIPIAHYFTAVDKNKNGQLDDDESIYLVLWDDGANDSISLPGSNRTTVRRKIYRLFENGNNKIEPGELIPVASENEKNNIIPVIYDRLGNFLRYKTDEEDLQNFANWFTYYRKRASAVKAAVGEAIVGLYQIQAGLISTNTKTRLGVQPLKVKELNATEKSTQTTNRDNTAGLLKALYAMGVGGKNALRLALDQAGRYYSGALNPSIGEAPFWEQRKGGGCQRTYAVAIIGSTREDAFSGIGNIDGRKGSPFADGWENTLADIALNYYENDLDPALPDMLPPSECDSASHQHMVTYGISFGAKGTLPFEDINQNTIQNSSNYGEDICSMNIQTPAMDWPQPINGHATSIDDLRHAAVNGRGLYLHAEDSMKLGIAMRRLAAHFGRPVTTTDSATVHSISDSDEVFLKTSYNTEKWSGDLRALKSSSLSTMGVVNGDILLWSAAANLAETEDIWDKRRVVTYGNGTYPSKGIPFRYDQLSRDQQISLGSDQTGASINDNKASRLVDFIRGREDKLFRYRNSVLGDIVHSIPVMAEETVFVGANDGMLHAFNSMNGEERFSYIPQIVFDRLSILGDKNYSLHHRFFVDGPISVGEVMVGEFLRQTLLIGGLGKGGKGYYCLRIGSRTRSHSGDGYGPYEKTFSVSSFSNSSSEDEVCKVVMWEYPGTQVAADGKKVSDLDMGYSFGKGYAVNGNSSEGKYRPLVIFGNGYDSDHGSAVLYILDAMDGSLLRKIDTGAVGENGLSTPALIDVNMDRKVDYVYAGDLKGNLWKFDLTSQNPIDWSVAYGVDSNHNSIIDADDGDQPMPVIQIAGKPITSRPDVMRMAGQCKSQAPGYLVIFGTGRYISYSDQLDASPQGLYGVWDYGDDSDDSEYLGQFPLDSNGKLTSEHFLIRRTILSEEKEKGKVVRTLSSEEFDYDLVEDTYDGDGIVSNNKSRKKDKNAGSNAGWYLVFPTPPDLLSYRGERIIEDIKIRGGKIVASSFAPADQPCHRDSASWIYVLDACNGKPSTMRSDEILLPWRCDEAITSIAIKKAQKQGQIDRLILIDRKGTINKEEFEGEKWGKLFWRQN